MKRCFDCMFLLLGCQHFHPFHSGAVITTLYLVIEFRDSYFLLFTNTVIQFLTPSTNEQEQENIWGLYLFDSHQLGSYNGACR